MVLIVITALARPTDVAYAVTMFFLMIKLPIVVKKVKNLVAGGQTPYVRLLVVEIVATHGHFAGL